MRRKRSRICFGHAHPFHEGQVLKLGDRPGSFRVVLAERDYVTVEEMTWLDRFLHWFLGD